MNDFPTEFWRCLDLYLALDCDRYTAIDFFAEHGFPPCRYPDFLAVSGDTADNIKGIPGIGKKGATELIQCSESTTVF